MVASNGVHCPPYATCCDFLVVRTVNLYLIHSYHTMHVDFNSRSHYFSSNSVISFLFHLSILGCFVTAFKNVFGVR